MLEKHTRGDLPACPTQHQSLLNLSHRKVRWVMYSLLAESYLWCLGNNPDWGLAFLKSCRSSRHSNPRLDYSTHRLGQGPHSKRTVVWVTTRKLNYRPRVRLGRRRPSLV